MPITYIKYFSLFQSDPLGVPEATPSGGDEFGWVDEQHVTDRLGGANPLPTLFRTLQRHLLVQLLPGAVALQLGRPHAERCDSNPTVGRPNKEIISPFDRPLESRFGSSSNSTNL